MAKDIKASLMYHIGRILHPFTRPRMIVRKKNFQGKSVKYTSIGNTTFIDHPKKFVLGDHTYIGHHNYIEASHGIDLGEGCQVTDFVSITTHSSHISIRLNGPTISKDPAGYIKGRVEIGKFTFIGPHTVIMPGTIIGKGCIVQAFSYVKGNFPDFSIISGQPAKVTGNTREIDKPYLEKYPDLKEAYDKWTI